MFRSPLQGRDLLLCTFLVVSSYLLLGPLLAGFGLWGLVLLQVLAFALPSLAVASLRGPLPESLGLRPMSGRKWLGTTLVGLSAWNWILLWISPLGLRWGNPEELHELTRQLELDQSPLALVLLAMAVVPALCEELFNRGVILAGLVPRVGRPSAIVLSSLLFGLSHLSWIRLLPTTMLGALAALVFLWSGSLWSAMWLHGLYNASLLLASAYSLEIAPWQTGISFGFTALGLFLLAPRPESLEPQQR